MLVISITSSVSYWRYFHLTPVKSGHSFSHTLSSSSSAGNDNFRILSSRYTFSTFAFLGAFGVTSAFGVEHGEENFVFGVVGGLVMLTVNNDFEMFSNS